MRPGAPLLATSSPHPAFPPLSRWDGKIRGAGEHERRPLGSGRPCLPLIPVSVQGLLYAASYSGVVQVPVANCSLYQSCGDCLLARDPYCAWSGSRCRPLSQYRPGVASR